MKRLSFILVFAFILSACSQNGGIDVGNVRPTHPAQPTQPTEQTARATEVPLTRVTMSIPSNWSGSTSGNALTIQNAAGSAIKAQKFEFKDLSTPNAASLQKYLNARFPSRNYEIIRFNGLEGVRADLVSTQLEKQSDIYLVSEWMDFVHVVTELKGDDILTGEQILSTAKVEYRGVSYTNFPSVTVTLHHSSLPLPESRRARYSFLGDCFSYENIGCDGVSVLFGNGGEELLTVGITGYDHGRIIELGADAEFPFDEIKVEGKYLVGPTTRVPVSDIYTVFTPQDPQKEQDRATLKEGYVYLIRTISWPDEDVVTKVRVDRLEPGKSVTLTYTKLVYVDKWTLRDQVEAINQYTRDVEMPMEIGEVTLYARSVWNNYFYSSFNFEFSTSGNMFITRNHWNLLFGNRPGEATFIIPFVNGDRGTILDVGTKDIAEISERDFQNLNRSIGSEHVEVEVVVGHTYLIYHRYYSNRLIYGAVQVLELGPEGEWVRLKFKRVGVR